MGTIALSDTTLTLQLSRADRVLGLLRDQSVPRSAVTDVDLVPDGVRAVRGVRAPGFAVPGRRLGPWRSRGVKRLVDVRSGQPALRVALPGSAYDELLVGSDDAEGLAARLRARA